MDEKLRIARNVIEEHIKEKLDFNSIDFGSALSDLLSYLTRLTADVEGLPKKRKICLNEWHSMGRLTCHKNSIIPRSCPECNGIESITGIEANKSFNEAIDLATSIINGLKLKIEELENTDNLRREMLEQANKEIERLKGAK